jgi:hypothetical protein
MSLSLAFSQLFDPSRLTPEFRTSPGLSLPNGDIIVPAGLGFIDEVKPPPCSRAIRSLACLLLLWLGDCTAGRSKGR